MGNVDVLFLFLRRVILKDPGIAAGRSAGGYVSSNAM